MASWVADTKIPIHEAIVFNLVRTDADRFGALAIWYAFHWRTVYQNCFSFCMLEKERLVVPDRQQLPPELFWDR